MKKVVVFCFVFLSIYEVFGQEGVHKDLIRKAKDVAGKIVTGRPMESDPVMLNAQLVFSDDKEQAAVIIKVNIHYNWHIYAFVPPTQPYIASKMILDLPSGTTAIGDWEKPNAYPSSDGVYLYKGELVFIHYLTIEKSSANGKINCGLYYQTCDLRQCLPPTKKNKTLTI